MKYLSNLQLILLALLTAFIFACSAEKPTTNNSTSSEQQAFQVSDKPLPKLKYTTGIRSILLDSKGNYWIGSHQEGVCLIQDDKLTYFTVSEGLSNNQIRSIQEDSNGVIWFGTGNGVSSYSNAKITNYQNEVSFLDDVEFPKDKWTKSDTDLFFNAGNQSGVYRWNQETLNYLPFPKEKEDQAFNQYATTAFSKGKDKLWIASYNAVFGYDGKDFEIIDNDYLGFTEEGMYLHVRSILEDSKGNVWIGNNGIGVLVKKGESITHFTKDMGLVSFVKVKNGPAGQVNGTLEHVFAIEEDSQGNIWFGDRDTGAWKFDGKTMTNYSIFHGLEGNFVQTIYQDILGNLWFGMGNGNLYTFNGKTFDRKYG